MSTYRALLFDVMATIVREPFFEVVPKALGIPIAELLAAKHPDAWDEFERNRIDEEAFRAKFFSDGRDYPHEQMRAAMVDAFDYLPGVEHILSGLKSRVEAGGPPIHYLSNYPIWYLLIEKKLALSRYGEWTFVSHKTGFRKPEPEAYQVAIDHFGCRPHELLFVDDRAINCKAAGALGIDTIKFTNAAALSDELRQRHLL